MTDRGKEITRREFLREVAVMTVAMGTVGLMGSGSASSSSSEEQTVESVFAKDKLYQEIPSFDGWLPDGSFKAGVFGMSLSTETTQWGKQETFLQVANPEKINDSDYDRFPVVQLVRADGGDAKAFFKKLRKSWEQIGKPCRVTEQQWQLILRKTSEPASQVWAEMSKTPELDLPKPAGRQFAWNAEALSDPLTREALSPQEREHREIFWLAKAKTTTPWPLDQGKYQDSWSSRKIKEHQYENWKKVKVTTFTYGEVVEVGPEGSLPFVTPLPWPGSYKQLGEWRE